MKTYPKLETLYNRDDDFKVKVGDYRRPEFGLVKQWVVQEKIDGTNIRIHFQRDADLLGSWVRGKTDAAQVPQPLLGTLSAWCLDVHDEIYKIMLEHDLIEYTLYGEGYGAKIQSGGYYRADQGFILFDVLANGIWLDWRRVMDTSTRLEIPLVPHLSYTMDEEAILDLVVSNYDSHEAVEKRAAEGVIARPSHNLYDQRGERVMWKLKGRDFARGR